MSCGSPSAQQHRRPAWLTLHSVGISTRQSVSRNSLRLPRMGNLAGPRSSGAPALLSSAAPRPQTRKATGAKQPAQTLSRPFPASGSG